MEKLTKSVLKEISPVKIYLEQIKEVVDILREEFGQNSIKIKTKDHLVAEIDELKNIGEKLFYLQIYSGPITVDLKSSGCSIYLREDNKVSLGVMVKIEEVLLKNERIFLSFILSRKAIPYSMAQGLAIFVFAFMLPNSFIQEYFYFIKSHYSVTALIVILYCSIFGLGIWYSYLYPEKATQIFTKGKIEMPGYFKREGDKIRTGLIVNIIIAIASFLLGYFIGGK